MFDKLNISQKHSVLVVLMLCILTMSVYWQVQDYEFINYDDNVYVTDNRYTQSGITLDGFCWAFRTEHFGLWNPLVWLSFMLDFQLFRFNAGGYHWTNVIIHIFNIVLLFFLFKNLTGAVWRSAFVAALFALHPINVESVAWISERKNVLSTFFWMLTMLFYVRYVKQPNLKRYLPIFIAFALGLMSKPMLVTLPFVLLLLDYWPLNRTAVSARSERDIRFVLNAEKEKLTFLILEKIPLFILSAISIFIVFYTPQSERGTMVPLQNITFIQRINNVIFSYGMYMKKLFWPADLSIHYMNFTVPIWQIFLFAIILIIITTLVCKYYKKYPYLPVGWFWYLGTLVPVIGFADIGDHTMADRYAYLTFIGLFVMIAWGMEQFFSKNMYLKKMSGFAGVLIIVLLTMVTYNQIKLWTNTITLFEDALKKDPSNYIANMVVASTMAKNGENEKALYYIDKALKAEPRLHTAYNLRGVVFLNMKKRFEAFKNFESAIQLNKFSPEPHYNLGLFYWEENNLDKAVEYFTNAIEVKNDYAEAHNYLGVVLIRKGKLHEGISQFEKALQINPNYKNAQMNLQHALRIKKNKNHGITG